MGSEFDDNEGIGLEVNVSELRAFIQVYVRTATVEASTWRTYMRMER